jgi:HD-GYP domain-containing protein (c-di-GMP phosphodiesterase class II)
MTNDKNENKPKTGARRELEPLRMLETIFEYVALISKEKDVDRILTLLADLGRELVAADRCTLWLLDSSKTKLWSIVAHGMPRIVVPSDKGVVSYAIKEKTPILINDAYADARFNPEVDKQTGYRTRNVIALPIFGEDGEAIGVYQAINKMTDEAVFDETDITRLKLAATYSGATLEFALAQQEIAQTQEDVIFMLGEAGETRSLETGNHVKRVAEYSRSLALAIGLSKEEAEILRMASPMHDIGKIAIADSILKKPARLDADEMEIMKTHAEIGYQILKNSRRKILKAAAIVAYEHHEAWNGKGYPRGLSGENIHIYGRISAIADVFDALGSERVYKKQWAVGDIFLYFKAQRGSQFDPKLVDAFFKSADELLAIRSKFSDGAPQNESEER